ncbi:uncharacterized protein K444DRAFT_340509 [Hyaloscypha bicolor E]|uniref:Uncharacterized protein n=1 Tax=Hyaloscypha bicolor E TaxID=1095630 RepID=A0A2J6TH51_9HELO|nr:uncharacterized protein K444DRAFT_340509 [Hyaloscypha bicolor E]PMD62362.1 hypothetical protein K444DRAFT_340509 [Hyaloscypha bicolor E]
MHWDEETYRFERIFLKEGLVDEARNEREDEEGDRRAREEWEAISDLKWRDPYKYSVEKAKYERRMRDLDLRGKGWTQEQIEAADRADAAVFLSRNIKRGSGSAIIYKHRGPKRMQRASEFIYKRSLKSLKSLCRGGTEPLIDTMTEPGTQLEEFQELSSTE